MLEKVSTDLKSQLPVELVDALLSSYDELKQNFYVSKHEPSELNGGKFCEVCVRILQYETNAGVYTPIGTSISDLIGKIRDFEKIPAVGMNESFRIHIPRVLVAIYNIRNKRGVGHLGGDVNPNSSDSSLLVACADWIMAELFRIYYQCPLDEAQEIVNALVQRRLILVHNIGKIKRVLLPTLSQRNQTILLLSSIYPEKASLDELVQWIEPSNKSRYRNDILRKLHKDRLVEYDELGWCMILPTGLNYAASQYFGWISKLEGR
jgi:hypothetical protein